MVMLLRVCCTRSAVYQESSSLHQQLPHLLLCQHPQLVAPYSVASIQCPSTAAVNGVPGA
jgi:hypothetical protein